jgi:PTS system glucitol/sorbitol-specific IIC component
MDAISKAVEAFTNIFTTGGNTFVGLVTGILPPVIVLLTMINTILKLVGEDRVNRFLQVLTKWAVIRYSIMPLLANILLTVPMEFAAGRFLKEEHKTPFYDAQVCLNHPPLLIFPHIHPSEIMIVMGIAQPIIDLGYSITPLAVRYFLAGLVVALIRGLTTDWMYRFMQRRKMVEATATAQ